MEVKISKKSYYLPEILIDIFRDWCKPGRDYSPKVAGAILHYMALDPATREFCEKSSHGNKNTIENAILQLKTKAETENPADVVARIDAAAKAGAKRPSKHRHGA